METATENKQISPPYVSCVSFLSFIDWLGSMDAMPVQIDRSLWQSKFNGTTGTTLISAARFLHLLKDEQPTHLLEELVRADKDTRPVVLAKVLRDAYGDEIVDQAATMTPKMFDEHLRGLGTTDGTHRKAASFLTNALKEAGVPVQPMIAKRARNRRPGSSRRASSQKNTQSSTSEPQAGAEPAATDAAANPRNERKLELQNGAVVSLVIESDMLSLPADDLDWLLSVVRMFDTYASKHDGESEKAADNENEGVTDD